MIKNFIMVDKYADSIGWAGFFHGHFWLLVICSFASLTEPGNSYPYCYDNIWADVVLKNGHPDYDSIYSVVDLFTWEGWLYMYVVHLIHYFIQITLRTSLFFLLFMVYYWQVLDEPFCVKGEIDLFGLDICDNRFMYGGIDEETIKKA